MSEPTFDTNLQAALFYAQLGWKVFPLKPGQKTPATQHGFKDATTDTAQIEGWWASNPSFNVGVATGEGSGLLVVDIDVKGAKNGQDTLDALEATHGALPPAALVRTGSGGFHAYYKATPGVGSGGSVPGPGIDIRANGGYVVAPPSTIEAGPYGWLTNGLDTLKTAPAWVYSRPTKEVAPLPSTPKGETTFDRAVALFNQSMGKVDWPASNGSCPMCGHNGCFGTLAGHEERWACFSGDHESDSGGAGIRGSGCWHGDALDVIAYEEGTSRAEFLRAGGFLKDEPDPAHGVLARVMGLGRDTSAGGEVSAEAEVSDPDRAAVISAMDAYAGRGKTRNVMPAPARFEDTYNEPDEIEMWLVKNLLDDKQFVGLVGQGKSAKTWALIHLAVCVASGKPAFNDERFEVERSGPVVLLLREDVQHKAKRRIAAEIRSLGLTPEQEREIRSRLYVWYSSQNSAMRLLDDVGYADFATHCLKIKPAVVMMDPLKKLHSQNENSAEEMEPVMERCLLLRELLGCTILLSHHMGKPNETTGKTRSIQLGRGSSTIGDSMEGQIAFTDTDDSDSPHSWTNTVTVMAKNGGAVPSFGLRLEIEDDEKGRAQRTTWTVDRETKGKTNLEDTAELISKVWAAENMKLAERGAEPVALNAPEIAKMIGKRKEIVRAALEGVLAVRGQIREVKVRGGNKWALNMVTGAAPGGPHAAKAFIPESK